MKAESERQEPMANPTATVTVNFNAGPNTIRVTPEAVEIRKNGKIEFSSPDADLVIICGDNHTDPATQDLGWFVKDDVTGNSAKNDVAFFVPKGGSRSVQVKDTRAITNESYSYSVVILTTDEHGQRDKQLHSVDPTVIIREN